MNLNFPSELHRFVRDWRKLRDRSHCFYCGRVMHGVHPSPFAETVEHVIADRTNNHVDNKVLACAGCNRARSCASLKDFRTWFNKPFYCETRLGRNLPFDTVNLHSKLLGEISRFTQNIGNIRHRMNHKMQRIHENLKKDLSKASPSSLSSQAL